MILWFSLMAIAIGTLMPIQAALNAELGRQLSNPYLSAFVSFSVGTTCLFVLNLILGSQFTQLSLLKEINPGLLLGGILGALFVSSSLFFIPKMGATSMMAAYVTGQLLMSVIVDHYGLFGLTSYQITFQRLLGVGFLLLGLTLIVKKSL